MVEILVLYYSVGGSVRRMAELVAEGVERVPGAAASLRTVPKVAPVTQQAQPGIPPEGAPYCELKDLERCAGLALGSPTRFGNMAAPLKHFLDGTSALWLAGGMVDKPAGVFTTTSSNHGGQETTLISMIVPLIHHGMLWVGVPFTEDALFETRTGGSPYGATQVATEWNSTLSRHEEDVARALGERVARIASRLAGR